MQKMRKRGIRVLPGGDYGFAWTPHGTYAKDLEYFVERIGFTPTEALLAATRLGGEIMEQPDSLGRIKAGYLADMILVNGNPVEDVKILQDRSRLPAIMKDGVFHRKPAATQMAAAT
jgi:imidazolonepropionase-like amidohydrolase